MTIDPEKSDFSRLFTRKAVTIDPEASDLARANNYAQIDPEKSDFTLLIILQTTTDKLLAISTKKASRTGRKVALVHFRRTDKNEEEIQREYKIVVADEAGMKNLQIKHCHMLNPSRGWHPDLNFVLSSHAGAEQSANPLLGHLFPGGWPPPTPTPTHLQTGGLCHRAQARRFQRHKPIAAGSLGKPW